MPMVEVAGKSFEVDEEGYLVDLNDWNEDIAKYWPRKKKLT
jgi:dissimilatory sulfite reductase related protein